MSTISFVTGAAGFIGSSLVRALLRAGVERVIGFDALTYSGHLANLQELSSDPRFTLVQGDICDRALLTSTLQTHQPNWLFHLAAETHVDRSIDGAHNFVTTNMVGTQNVLDCARQVCSAQPDFRFIHISTDEVFGDLEPNDPPFSEASPYRPSSPYAASKAGSDHLVRAAHRTHGLPILISNCSNNYGPRQLPEKLIPLMILNALAGRALPIYGDGQNRRDWLHVEDHARALITMAQHGRIGETYCVGGDDELSNLEVIDAICGSLADFLGKPLSDFTGLKTFVADRPGHDRRYAVNSAKLRTELGWSPQHGFANGINATVAWYLENAAWVEDVSGNKASIERLGLAAT